MDQIELEGMPRAATLRLVASEGQVLVAWGNSLVCRYESDDNGMRNLVIVALTDAGRRIDEVARVFGLTATYVSILRGRAHRDGSAGLVKRRGRPRKLSERQVARAQVWAGAGWTQRAIADRLGVARWVHPAPAHTWARAPPQALRAAGGPRPGVGHLPLGDLAGAPAALDQPGRTIPVGPPAQDRHVCRGQPEDARDLIDTPARVRQRHDHEVAHPVVVALVPADQ